MSKVSLITLGCPRNTVDSEVMVEIISRGDYIFTANRKSLAASSWQR